MGDRSGAEIYPRPRPTSNYSWQRALYLPLTILAWMVIGIIVLWLLGHITHALVVIVLAIIVAFALAPLIALLRRWLARPLAIVGAYLIGIGLVFSLGSLLVATAAGQVVILVQNLPDYVNHLKNLSPQVVAFLAPFGVTSASLQSFAQQLLTELQAIGTSLAFSLLNLFSRVVSILVDTVLILILSVYFTIDGARVVGWLKENTPPGFRPLTRYFLDVTNSVVGGYVRGTLTLALLIGALVGLGLQVLGIPYAVLLGVLAFFMEFVPIVGVLISGAISLLVSLPSGVGITLAVLVYFILVHVIEADIVGPRVMGKAVGIHPAVGIIALVTGTELFGVWGALFGAPLAGLLQAILVGIWRIRQSNPKSVSELPALVAEDVKAPLEKER